MHKRYEALVGGLLISAGILSAGASILLYAAGTGPSENWSETEKTEAPETAMSLYDKGVAADKACDNAAALDYFMGAQKLDSKNPEILNMLAHSERKLGMLNEAINDYWTALKLKPRFPEAREYMGEAYLQAALSEIDTLEGYGKDGEQQRDSLIRAFKTAAAALPEPKTPAEKKEPCL